MCWNKLFPLSLTQHQIIKLCLIKSASKCTPTSQTGFIIFHSFVLRATFSRKGHAAATVCVALGEGQRVSEEQIIVCSRPVTRREAQCLLDRRFHGAIFLLAFAFRPFSQQPKIYALSRRLIIFHIPKRTSPLCSFCCLDGFMGRRGVHFLAKNAESWSRIRLCQRMCGFQMRRTRRSDFGSLIESSSRRPRWVI